MKCYHLPSRTHVNYFEVSKAIAGGVVSTSVLPPRTFSSSTTAFHLALKPSLRISIDEAAELYGLPDLRSTVTDYFHRASRSGCPVVENIQAWFKVRVQQPTYHSRESFQSPQSLIASPPSTQSPSGRYDFAVVNQSDESEWPSKGLEGMFCCVVRCPAIYSLCYRAYNRTGSPNLSRPSHRLFSCVCSTFSHTPPPLTCNTTKGAAGLHMLKRCHAPNWFSAVNMDKDSRRTWIKTAEEHYDTAEEELR